MHVKHLKITFVSIITFVATALLFAGCSKEETPHLELSTTEMTLFNLGEAATFDINSSSVWTISYDTDFLQVTPNSGKGGATTTVTVELTEENNTGADRQSSISVKAGQLAESVTVRNPAMMVGLSTKTLGFGNEGGTESFTITANCRWNIDLSTLPEWISSVSPAEGDSDAEVTVTVKENSNRKDTNRYNLRVKYSTEYVTLEISQEPAPNAAPTAPVPQIPADGATDVPVIPEFAWKASSDPEGDPITYTVMYSKDRQAWWPLYTGSGSACTSGIALEAMTQYHYKIVADDGYAGGTAESEIFTFTTGAKNVYADGESVIYLNSSKPDPIELVFTGDGYIAEDYEYGGAFDSDIDSAIEALFAIEPYKSYKEYFKVYKVAAYSKERGTSIKSQNIYRETAFSTTIEGGNSTYTECDYDGVFDFIRAHTGLQRKGTTVCVVINHDYYAGTCSMELYKNIAESNAIAMICRNKTYHTDQHLTQFENVVRHELGGHGFGLLLDEYIYDEMGAATAGAKSEVESSHSYNTGLNLSVTSDRDLVPWKHFFGTEGYSHVGVFEGGFTYVSGIWRSEQISCMDDNRPYFNSQSRYLIVKRIMEMAGEEFTFPEFVEKDVEKTDNSGIGKTKSYGIPFDIRPLAPPVIVYKE